MRKSQAAALSRGVLERVIGIETGLKDLDLLQAVTCMFNHLTRNPEKRMRLLTPDGTKPQRDDFIWCLPVAMDEWMKLHELSHKFRTITPNGVCYLHRIGRGRQKILLVLQATEQTDDDIAEGCAWMRLIKDFRQPIYVMPYTEHPANMKEIIASHTSVNPKIVQSLDSLEEDKP